VGDEDGKRLVLKRRTDWAALSGWAGDADGKRLVLKRRTG